MRFTSRIKQGITGLAALVLSACSTEDSNVGRSRNPEFVQGDLVGHYQFENSSKAEHVQSVKFYRPEGEKVLTQYALGPIIGYNGDPTDLESLYNSSEFNQYLDALNHTRNENTHIRSRIEGVFSQYPNPEPRHLKPSMKNIEIGSPIPLEYNFDNDTEGFSERDGELEKFRRSYMALNNEAMETLGRHNLEIYNGIPAVTIRTNEGGEFIDVREDAVSRDYDSFFISGVSYEENGGKVKAKGLVYPINVKTY